MAKKIPHSLGKKHLNQIQKALTGKARQKGYSYPIFADWDGTLAFEPTPEEKAEKRKIELKKNIKEFYDNV